MYIETEIKPGNMVIAHVFLMICHYSDVKMHMVKYRARDQSHLPSFTFHETKQDKRTQNTRTHCSNLILR